MKAFIEFLNEAAAIPSRTVQFGYDDTIEDDLIYAAAEDGVYVDKTNNRPIDPRDINDQYLVSGRADRVISFLKNNGLDMYYNTPKFVVKGDKTYGFTNVKTASKATKVTKTTPVKTNKAVSSGSISNYTNPYYDRQPHSRIIQFGYGDELGSWVFDAARKANVTIYNTNNRPIDSRSARTQYLVHGGASNITAFFEMLGLEKYNNPKYVVKGDKTYGFKTSNTLSKTVSKTTKTTKTKNPFAFGIRFSWDGGDEELKEFAEGFKVIVDYVGGYDPLDHYNQSEQYVAYGSKTLLYKMFSDWGYENGEYKIPGYHVKTRIPFKHNVVYNV